MHKISSYSFKAGFAKPNSLLRIIDSYLFKLSESKLENQSTLTKTQHKRNKLWNSVRGAVEHPFVCNENRFDVYGCQKKDLQWSANCI